MGQQWKTQYSLSITRNLSEKMGPGEIQAHNGGFLTGEVTLPTELSGLWIDWIPIICFVYKHTKRGRIGMGTSNCW